jgi:purine-binding chemotaxis protein CheW
VSTTTTQIPSTGAAATAGKYLTFALGAEEYGLEILKVREIIGMMEITAVPRSPAYVKGVINLRGQVISVADLRAKFGMEAVARTEQTCVIVVEIAAGNGRKLSMGIIVDHVSEVLDVAAGSIEPAPDFGAAVDTAFILGMGKIGKGVKILLDIDKVLTGEERAHLAEVAEAAAQPEIAAA